MVMIRTDIIRLHSQTTVDILLNYLTIEIILRYYKVVINIHSGLGQSRSDKTKYSIH